jgi:ethanolamine permease
MVALIRLRKIEPDLERPFKVPLYPIVPIVALVIAVISLIALFIFNIKLGIIYISLMTLTFTIFKFWKKNRAKE